MLRRVLISALGLGSALALLLVCYRGVLFEGEQFAFRDSARFYYPLYHRVQQEWAAGRWPLWDRWQNGGAPLLGNPMAAVLYPGKVVYAALPYAWGARLYVVLHTVVAFFGMRALGLGLGVSRVGATIGGLSYAFGAPVLFQYGNVIYLVGAAWAPWGLRAVDRLMRQGERLGALELAVVLALQVLGGDPQAAYLTAASGAGYALILALPTRGTSPRPTRLALVLGFGAIWVSGTIGLSIARPGFVGAARAWGPWIGLAAWGAAGIGLGWAWRQGSSVAGITPRLAALAGSCLLALVLSAAQLLPVLEFIARSGRVSAQNVSGVDKFSLEPYRLVELLWPNPFGTPCPENRSWLQGVPPAGGRDVWVASLYLGGLPVVLALAAFGFRDGDPRRRWLSAIALIGLAASFGRFGGPLWWARLLPSANSLGPHDPAHGLARLDLFLEDGVGSPYAILATLLPGFGAFRYPSKLLTFAMLGLSGLAGVGWDRLVSGESRRVHGIARIGLVASLAGVALALAGGGRAVAYLEGRVPPDPMFGPADIPSAWAGTQLALAQGAVILGLVLLIARWGARNPRAAGACALWLLAADLALANAGLVWTVPQAVLDAPSEAARRIEAAERLDPAPGPFRISRVGNWYPRRFLDRRSPQRFREVLEWERATLSPLDALPIGLEYCVTLGTVELDDYTTFFRPQLMPVPDSKAPALGLAPGTPVVYFPRRSFDLWGARYFLLPFEAEGWQSRDRGFASLLDDTEVIHPDSAADVLHRRRGRWAEDQDWQIRRNRAAYPRAWLVHSAKVRPPSAGPADRASLMKVLVFKNDPIWNDPDRPVFDLRSAAWIETNDPSALHGALPRIPVDPSESESVAVVAETPQRVKLKVRLARPGLVVLADTLYPGWRLSIDGKPAPIYRTNRLMRGAATPQGEHTLVYTFEPDSFRIGAVVSLAGVSALATAFAWSRFRRRIRLPSEVP